MNRATGIADPQNPVVPFAKLRDLHFARVLVLEDTTLDDIEAYGLPRVNYPVYLAVLADFDGDAENFVGGLDPTGERWVEAHLFLLSRAFARTPILRGWMRSHIVVCRRQLT